jgi:hypothetical protein
MLFVFPDPSETPEKKARMMLAKKTKGDCVRNVQTMVNFCVPHPELSTKLSFWEEVLRLILEEPETFKGKKE